MTGRFEITWHDRGREPTQPPNPAYPDGIDLDVTAGAMPVCQVPLPYPAKRIGYYTVFCKTCRYSVACTTAGRPDDPRSIKLPCHIRSAA
jgi:hypothetical protein